MDEVDDIYGVSDDENSPLINGRFRPYTKRKVSWDLTVTDQPDSSEESLTPLDKTDPELDVELKQQALAHASRPDGSFELGPDDNKNGLWAKSALSGVGQIAEAQDPVNSATLFASINDLVTGVTEMVCS